ncbi:ABC transporter substrate-binding protein [Acinetobacter sp. Ver3]|uniref:ABC transporter substrate-binding protein n=1 Tax=Acinetobacter sp. Ver3 TaxID=466088 RepID=UPI000451BA77|nr:iron-siderophore ABC transporter substrate-binding protein [Acinetobacter sp. Ver3]EZQ10521.1 ABC transporter substrate-binding protein [Acinetobacter sp. Ver3]
MKYKIAIMLSAITLFTACSQSNEPSSRDSKATAESQINTTRQIEDALGRQVTIPVQPQRVVVLSELDLDSAIALGIKPIGSSYVRGQSNFPDYLKNETQQIASVGNFGQPSMEQILTLQPDLIIAGSMIDTQMINQLQQIAPTAVSFARGEPWKDSFKKVAHLLNKEQQAQKALEAYDQYAQEAQQKLHAQQGQSVSVIRWTANGPVYMLNDSFASQVLKDIGLTRPQHQQQPGASHTPPISRERFDQIDADWLIIGSHLNAEKQLAELEKLPEFQRLNAAKNKHYFVVDASMWTGIGGPHAARHAIDDVLKHLHN